MKNVPLLCYMLLFYFIFHAYLVFQAAVLFIYAIATKSVALRPKGTRLRIAASKKSNWFLELHYNFHSHRTSGQLNKFMMWPKWAISMLDMQTPICSNRVSFKQIHNLTRKRNHRRILSWQRHGVANKNGF